MCVKLIVDASAFRHFCENSARTAGHQLRRWVANGHGVVVYSDEEGYRDELDRYQIVRTLLRDLRRRGAAIVVKADTVLIAHERIPDRPVRRSNDAHILALAATSNATVLFSCDCRLQSDFSSNDVLGNVGRKKRRSVPLKIHVPDDTTEASKRQRFLNARRCGSAC